MKIRQRNLELIAEHLSNLIMPSDLCSLLRECGVPEEILEKNYLQYDDEAIYELFAGDRQASEYLLNQTFGELDKTGEHELAYKVITTLLHPLTFKGNALQTNNSIKAMNDLLRYDNLELDFIGKEVVLRPLRSYQQIKDEDNLYEQQMDDTIAEAFQTIKIKYLNDLSLLKSTYQLLINIVEIFLEDITFLDERLNEAYIKLFKIAWQSKYRIFSDDSVKRLPGFLSGEDFYKPFHTLFGAESQEKDLETPATRHRIRVRMYEYLGEITSLCIDCNANNIVADSKTQEYLNEISLYLSEIKEQRQNISKKIVDSVNNEIEWPEIFNWDEKGNFRLSDDKKLVFGADKSTRKDIFTLIVDGKGKWVTVSSIANATDQKENYVRIVIKQLNKKIIVQDLKDILVLEPRGRVDEAGAYRAVPFPKSLKQG